MLSLNKISAHRSPPIIFYVKLHKNRANQFDSLCFGFASPNDRPIADRRGENLLPSVQQLGFFLLVFLFADRTHIVKLFIFLDLLGDVSVALSGLSV